MSAYGIWGLSCHILTLALSLHSGAAYTYLKTTVFLPMLRSQKLLWRKPFHTMATILETRHTNSPKFLFIGSRKNLNENEPEWQVQNVL